MSQQEFNLNGYVIDQHTGETLIGANIYSYPSKQGTASNSYGYFSMNIATGMSLFTCSYMGYITDSLQIKINSDSTHNFYLSPQTESLKEIVLKSKYSSVKSVQNSIVNIPVKQVKKMPALLGEGDVLKTIQLLPGVQSGNEGTSGFYVRGGGPDQNLILLDGVPIYNSSHLLGFFSIFNVDVIKNINLTKGGFPARFGGRLSSVLEIDTKDGNMKEWQVEGGLSLISGKITIQGPIKKDRTSIIISGRRTWIDLLKKQIFKLSENLFTVDVRGSGNYYFYDINTKINHKFSNKDRLYISAYSGKDMFFMNIEEENVSSQEVEGDHGNTASSRFVHPLNSSVRTFNGNTDFGLSWNNFTTSIRWNHLIGNKIFTNTTLLYSSYKFDNTIGTNNATTEEFSHNSNLNTSLDEHSNYLYRSGLKDLGFKIDIDYSLNTKHYIKLGASYTKHDFFPGYIEFFADYLNFKEDTLIVFSDNIKPDDVSLYLEDSYKINKLLSANLGIHYNLYKVNKKSYHDLQPRISIRYLLNEASSIKLSYATMQQNIHLLTNSSFGLPNDMWVPSTELVEPQKSKQIALGYYIALEKGTIMNWIDFQKHNFEASIELYYKTMNNLITFSEGTNILGSNFSAWEDRIDKDGIGIAQGIEFFIKKKTGRLNGWVGYTLSKTTRQFKNINLGRVYPYKFDRPHDLSIFASYMIKKGVSFNTTFVYGSGNTITMPIAQYILPVGTNSFQQYFEYGEKNQFRLEPYHRLDIGCSFTKETKWGERTWTVSIYNVYSRQNPFFIYLQEDGKEEEGTYQYATHTPTQVSLFPILPSVSYSFKF